MVHRLLFHQALNGEVTLTAPTLPFLVRAKFKRKTDTAPLDWTGADGLQAVLRRNLTPLRYADGVAGRGEIRLPYVHLVVATPDPNKAGSLKDDLLNHLAVYLPDVADDVEAKKVIVIKNTQLGPNEVLVYFGRGVWLPPGQAGSAGIGLFEIRAKAGAPVAKLSYARRSDDVTGVSRWAPQQQSTLFSFADLKSATPLICEMTGHAPGAAADGQAFFLGKSSIEAQPILASSNVHTANDQSYNFEVGRYVVAGDDAWWDPDHEIDRDNAPRWRQVVRAADKAPAFEFRLRTGPACHRLRKNELAGSDHLVLRALLLPDPHRCDDVDLCFVDLAPDGRLVTSPLLPRAHAIVFERDRRLVNMMKWFWPRLEHNKVDIYQRSGDGGIWSGGAARDWLALSETCHYGSRKDDVWSRTGAQVAYQGVQAQSWQTRASIPYPAAILTRALETSRSVAAPLGFIPLNKQLSRGQYELDLLVTADPTDEEGYLSLAWLDRAARVRTSGAAAAEGLASWALGSGRWWRSLRLKIGAAGTTVTSQVPGPSMRIDPVEIPHADGVAQDGLFTVGPLLVQYKPAKS